MGELAHRSAMEPAHFQRCRDQLRCDHLPDATEELVRQYAHRNVVLLRRICRELRTRHGSVCPCPHTCKANKPRWVLIWTPLVQVLRFYQQVPHEPLRVTVASGDGVSGTVSWLSRRGMRWCISTPARNTRH